MLTSTEIAFPPLPEIRPPVVTDLDERKDHRLSIFYRCYCVRRGLPVWQADYPDDRQLSALMKKLEQSAEAGTLDKCLDWDALERIRRTRRATRHPVASAIDYCLSIWVHKPTMCLQSLQEAAKDSRQERLEQDKLESWFCAVNDVPKTADTVGFARSLLKLRTWDTGIGRPFTDAILEADVAPDHWVVTALSDPNHVHLPIIGVKWIEELAA